MQSFEQTISAIRNILRIEGITGLNSINHCVALVVCRYLTIDKCKEFKIPLQFAYENFLKDCDDQKAMEKFFNLDADKDCLYVHLNEKLHFTSFKNLIKSPVNFVNIYKKLSDIKIEQLFDKMDVVGAIYEQIPFLFRLIFTENMIDNIIEDAVDFMKEFLGESKIQKV